MSYLSVEKYVYTSRAREYIVYGTKGALESQRRYKGSASGYAQEIVPDRESVYINDPLLDESSPFQMGSSAFQEAWQWYNYCMISVVPSQQK